MNIVLVGFMGSGKTTVGKKLASRLGYRFIDCDHIIEQEQGCQISEIFHYADENHFRQLETVLIKRLRRMSNIVLSTGGGILTTEGNLKILKSIGKVVYLQANLDETFERIKKNSARPLLQTEDPLSTMKEIFSQREHLYLQSDIIVDTTSKNIYQITNEIIHAL